MAMLQVRWHIDNNVKEFATSHENIRVLKLDNCGSTGGMGDGSTTPSARLISSLSFFSF